MDVACLAPAGHHKTETFNNTNQLRHNWFHCKTELLTAEVLAWTLLELWKLRLESHSD